MQQRIADYPPPLDAYYISSEFMPNHDVRAEPSYPALRICASSFCQETFGERACSQDICAAFAHHVIGRDAILAVDIRHLRINKGVAFDLTKNRRAILRRSSMSIWGQVRVTSPATG